MQLERQNVLQKLRINVFPTFVILRVFTA